MFRKPLFAGAIVLTLAASQAQACDGCGDSDIFYVAAYGRSVHDPTAGTVDVTAARQEVEALRERNMADARSNLLSRASIKVEEPVTTLAAAPEPPRADASGSQPSVR